MPRSAIATRPGLKGHLTRIIDKIKLYKCVSITAEFDNNITIETEMLR